MSQQARVSPLYSLLPADIEGFDSLAELALDMHWAWNHATDGVWRTLDPTLWDAHAKSLGCFTDGFARQNRTRACRSCLPQEHG